MYNHTFYKIISYPDFFNKVKKKLNAVNVLIFAVANFHGFCQENILAVKKLYMLLKIYFASTIFRDFLSTLKISMFTVCNFLPTCTAKINDSFL